nr:MAG TPA: hypothetical protein [Caudoviricetes sp.]
MTLTQERNIAIRQTIPACIGRYSIRQVPAPRFYISEKQAERLIYAYFRRVYPRLQEKKRLQIALVSTHDTLIKEFPTISKAELFSKIVMHPAPEFFITLRTFKSIINNQ